MSIYNHNYTDDEETENKKKTTLYNHIYIVNFQVFRVFEIHATYTCMYMMILNFFFQKITF
jgi:hypothetical protein